MGKTIKRKKKLSKDLILRILGNYKNMRKVTKPYRIID